MENLEELRLVPAIGDLPQEELSWLAARLSLKTFVAGEMIGKEGDPADAFYIMLEGEGQYRRESDPLDTRVTVIRAGNIGGRLPFSRLTHWKGTFRGLTSGRCLVGSTSIFPELIQQAPLLLERLVGIMSDRIRFFTREDQQRDKLAALGKLSAGLAHELNNPAAAAKRAALNLSEAQNSLREAIVRLDALNLKPEQRKVISHFEKQALQSALASTRVDSLTQSELEDELASVLEEQGIHDASRPATVLAEISIDAAWLRKMIQEVGKDAFPDALERVVSQVLVRGLAKEVESSTSRISELVKAIKEYTYMDQSPIQEIDIHAGIESTLVMLRYKIKHGITLSLQFDRTLPPICAYASELNQVWTNLIDNAADAMKDGGTITIRTLPDQNCIRVEVCDTGSGIPEEIQDKIFEPFFTTKKMGEGTGMGLDTVYRIVRKHHGDIHVESAPGNTCFQVRLPFKQPR